MRGQGCGKCGGDVGLVGWDKGARWRGSRESAVVKVVVVCMRRRMRVGRSGCCRIATILLRRCVGEGLL